MTGSVHSAWSETRAYLLELCATPIPALFRTLAAEHCEPTKTIDLLAGEAHRRFQIFLASVELEKQISVPPIEATPDGSMFRLDVAAATMLEGLGDYGRRYAAEIRRVSVSRALNAGTTGLDDDSTGELLHIWSPLPGEAPLFVQGLTKVVFHDVVEPQIQRAHENPPALSVTIAEDLARLLRRGVRVDAERGVLTDHRGNTLCRIASATGGDSAPSEQDLEVVSDNVASLRTLQAHRVIRFIITESHAAWILEADRYNEVLVQRGWTGLAEAVGVGRSKNAVQHLRRLLEVLSRLRFDWPSDCDGRILSFEFARAVGHGPSSLQIRVGEALLPGFVHTLNNQKQKERLARLLVPVLPLPPLCGRKGDWGPQATLQMLAVVELQGHPHELAAGGGVPIPQKRWRELAEEAGLSPSTLVNVVEAWTEDRAAKRPFLQRRIGDRYSLADTRAHEFLVTGAKRRVTGRDRGRRSATRRKKRVEQLSRNR